MFFLTVSPTAVSADSPHTVAVFPVRYYPLKLAYKSCHTNPASEKVPAHIRRHPKESPHRRCPPQSVSAKLPILPKVPPSNQDLPASAEYNPIHPFS